MYWCRSQGRDKAVYPLERTFLPFCSSRQKQRIINCAETFAESVILCSHFISLLLLLLLPLLSFLYSLSSSLIQVSQATLLAWPAMRNFINGKNKNNMEWDVFIWFCCWSLVSLLIYLSLCFCLSIAPGLQNNVLTKKKKKIWARHCCICQAACHTE